MLKKVFWKTALFSVCFCILFSFFQTLLCRKETEGVWNNTTKRAGFYNAPRNEFDVIFFGSSNTYCSFNPLVLWEETGLKSYVFATQNQPIWATYYYMKDAFKRQTPKLAVLDVLMLTKHTEYYDDGVNYSFADDFPFSWDKLRLIQASVPFSKQFDLLVPFTKYHSRWDELTEADYTFRRSEQRDPFYGYTFLAETYPDAIQHDVSDVVLDAELYEKNMEYFKKIIALCQEQGVELMLVKTPNNKTTAQEAHYRTITALVADYGLYLSDYNTMYPQIGLDLKTDFYDKSHLNFRGAEKFTRFFAQELNLVPAGDTNGTNAQWEADLSAYRTQVNELN